MLSNKLLSTLPFLAAQAAAIGLATSEPGHIAIHADILDVVKVFYPNCEALKGDLSIKNSGKGITCADSIEQNKKETKDLLEKLKLLATS